MSDELRAPDPTLTALGEQDVVVDWTAPHGRVPVVHSLGHGCEVDLYGFEPADIARWFSVPCRECFPSAPPPGHRKGWTLPQQEAPHDYPDPDLAWQIAG